MRQPFLQNWHHGAGARRKALPWLLSSFLICLLLTITIWLPRQAQQLESNERQEKLIADTLWVEQAIRFQMQRDEVSIGLIAAELTSEHLSQALLAERIKTLVRNNHELKRITWFDADGKVIESTDAIAAPFSALSAQSQQAAQLARASKMQRYSQLAPLAGQSAPLMLDFHTPLFIQDRYAGSLVASYVGSSILDELVPWWFAQDNEIVLSDSDDHYIAKMAAGGTGRGVYTHSRTLDLPGANLVLHTNSVKGKPTLLPNLLVGSVIALSIGLLWCLWALWRDINRRLAAENALRQQISFRTAMENSLITGLRARDLQGRITYVNPAFCNMVDMKAEELIGALPPMPYWAPEAMKEYEERLAKVLAGNVTPQFETIFQRANGERFPVLVFESPLVDDSGRQTGWMGSILDISDRKKIEELNRQQQEKLQASARLASMGELASTLAHELNQPLAAISSYTSGALNLLKNDAGTTNHASLELLKPALEKANAQAQRAGQIIRSVHAFVKKREPMREALSLNALIDSVIPLMELQARQFQVKLHVNIDPVLPEVLADRVLLEQVLLNLTRNGIESMLDLPVERRRLHLTAELDSETRAPNTPLPVVISVIDHGHGIAEEVANRLFSPFFSTKAEGMGMGLSICRTTIEFHGGTLTHGQNPEGGSIFRFTLPTLAELPKRLTAT